MRYPEGPGVLRSLLKESSEDIVMAIVEDPTLLLYVEDLLEQFDALAKVARDLYGDAGVDDIDPRLDYLMVQIGREVWNDFAAHIEGSNPAKESRA